MKILHLAALTLALSLTATANVIPASGYTGLDWQPTTLYVAVNVAEYEPLEEYPLAWVEVGVTNVGSKPNINPQLWQNVGPEKAVPEPGTMILMGLGGVLMWVSVYLNRRRH